MLRAYAELWNRHRGLWLADCGTPPEADLRDGMDPDLLLPGCPRRWRTWWQTAPSVADPAAFDRWQRDHIPLHPEALAFWLAERRLEVRLTLAGRAVELFPVTKTHPPLRTLAEGYFAWGLLPERPFAVTVGVTRDEGEEAVLEVDAATGAPALTSLDGGRVLWRGERGLSDALAAAPLIVGWR
ncbi:MAG: hypothetical protein GX418_10750 [Clostridiales bacterium]|nr:hypothetical protein [Clostridiales bacterium]